RAGAAPRRALRRRRTASPRSRRRHARVARGFSRPSQPHPLRGGRGPRARRPGGRGLTAPVLAMDGVRKAFGSGHARVEALRGVDLVIDAGEFVMVTGPSGSGKSTLLHLSALLDAPTAGAL